MPCAGSLSYRGYDIKELTRGFIEDDRYGFEETTYLLLFGKLPNGEELENFTKLLANQRSLPTNFVRDVIMKAPSKDIMNALSRSVLTLYCYDKEPDDISLPNVLRQCLNLISVFPLLSVYGYQAYNHYVCGKSLYIHNPKKELSTAENILRMLRPDKKYSHLEAKILDLALIPVSYTHLDVYKRQLNISTDENDRFPVSSTQGGYSFWSGTAWKSMKNQVKKIVIKSGITSISENAFNLSLIHI